MEMSIVLRINAATPVPHHPALRVMIVLPSVLSMGVQRRESRCATPCARSAPMAWWRWFKMAVGSAYPLLNVGAKSRLGNVFRLEAGARCIRTPPHVVQAWTPSDAIDPLRKLGANVSRAAWASATVLPVVMANAVMPRMTAIVLKIVDPSGSFFCGKEHHHHPLPFIGVLSPLYRHQYTHPWREYYAETLSF